MGSHRVGHDWSDLAAAAAYYYSYNKFFLDFKYMACIFQSFTFNPEDILLSLISWDSEILLAASILIISSVQFSSVAQSCLTFCDPMNRSTPGLPVHHQLPEFIQTHVHWVSDAIQPSHPLSSPSPPAPNPSQHQSLTSNLICITFKKGNLISS